MTLAVERDVKQQINLNIPLSRVKNSEDLPLFVTQLFNFGVQYFHPGCKGITKVESFKTFQ